MYNYSNYITNNGNCFGTSNINQMFPSSTHRPINVVDSYEGFIRGNMFADLYQPYVAGEPFNLNPMDEREALMDKVRETDFAIIDLALYLDVHPDDEEALRLSTQYRNQNKQWLKEYEGKYGPITKTSDVLDTYPWNWIMSPWPWEVK